LADGTDNLRRPCTRPPATPPRTDTSARAAVPRCGDHPADRRRNAASARWGAVTAGAPPATARARRSPRHSSSRADQLIRGTVVVPGGLMHPALAENLIRAGERPGRALRPVPCWTVWPRGRGRFPATTNAGKRLYLLRHGGKEWLDEDRHSRIAV